jgi:hypothetical protein
VADWKKIELSGEPLLLIGLREEGAFKPYRINVDKGVHPALLQVGKDTLKWLESKEPIAYTPYVEQQDGEYLTIETESLLTEAEGSEESAAPSEKEEVAAIVRMIRGCAEVEEMGAGQLIERLAKRDFYLQAICLKIGSKRIGFVTKSRPLQVMKRSWIPLGKDDATDRLKRITLPELVLESDVHAIVGEEEVAVINRTQFQFLVSDTPLISNFVPAQVKRIAQEFKGRGVVLSANTQAALLSSARESIRLAKRLDAFAERVKVMDVSRISDGAGFKTQKLAPGDFVNKAGEIECDSERVPELLDALEGRFFGDAFSDEDRRADRFRKR